MITDPQPALQLRDIHLPGAPAFWPPAPGWWLLAAVLAALMVWAALFGWRRYRIYRQRRRVLLALATLEDALESERAPAVLARMSILLRRLALLRFPRRQVAALSGEAWLRFLDESGGNGRFAHGPGQVLATGPYQRALDESLDPAGLAALLREWVKTNVGA